MHVQAPTLTTSHRAPLIAGLAGLATAAAVAGAIAISNGEDSSTPAAAPVTPAVVQSSPDRVWDGSPLLRGTESAPGVVSPSQQGVDRVWDGSPLLRGTEVRHAGAANTFRHSGGPSTLRHSGGPRMSVTGPTTPENGIAARSPEGFHTQP